MNKTAFKIVIPARYASTRLPGKPLLEVAGKPMLQHVYESALQSGADDIIIATDDERIEALARGFNATVCMTSADHSSGTERLAEVAETLRWDDAAIVVNVQGDEPLMPAALIIQVAEDLANNETAAVATLAYPVETPEEAGNQNIVKVVRDRNGNAMYFSRALIPCDRDGDGAGALRHIGLYAYRAGFLNHYRALQPSPLESIERLEQLRVLWHGLKIHVGIASEMPGPGVDTMEDLIQVEKLLSENAPVSE
jgi:3-deoxy-manno-octulosonate cytidylyltransferase (CMP-KDO synthetase)